MRIRQVKPSFWTDSVLSTVSYPARLFYIGLWTVADDAGWIEWDPATIGASLIPYEAAKRRLELIDRWTRELLGAGRVRLLECGCGVVPTLETHQRHAGGNRSYQVRDLHRQRHVQTSTDKSGPVQTSSFVGNGNGKERNGTPAGAMSSTGERPFDVIDGKLVDKSRSVA